MDERSAIAVMSGERCDGTARLLRALCRVAASGYSAAVRVRNLAYDKNWLRVHRAAVPVISVGNLTTGGTGKTPVVAWLVDQLVQRGYSPGILSRGYRSLDGMTNDEALVLERLCPGTPHVQQRDRVQGASEAIREFGCDVLVLDDGYQHRRLHRDLDLLLIDALQPWGFGHLLPRGLLREPLSSLWRADFVVVTRGMVGDRPSAFPEISSQLRRVRGTDRAAVVGFTPQRWLSPTGTQRPIQQFASQRMAAFCGIGNPAGFWKTLEPLGCIVDRRTFPDHHHYSRADLDQLEAWRSQLGVEVLATTVKDLVKIAPEHPVSRHVWAVEIGCDVTWGRDSLLRALDCVCPAKEVVRRAA